MKDFCLVHTAHVGSVLYFPQNAVRGTVTSEDEDKFYVTFDENAAFYANKTYPYVKPYFRLKVQSGGIEIVE